MPSFTESPNVLTRRLRTSSLCAVVKDMRPGFGVSDSNSKAEDPPGGDYPKEELKRAKSVWHAGELKRLGYNVTVYRGFFDRVSPPVDAAWAVKRWGNS